MKKKIIVFLLIINLLTVNQFVFAVSTAELNSTKNKKSEAAAEIKEAKDKLAKINNQKDTNQNDLNSLKQKVNNLTTEIVHYEEKLKDLDAQTKQKEKEIEENKKEYVRKEEILKKRLVTLYNNGQYSYMEVLLKASNYWDFLSYYKVLSNIVESDNKLLEELSETKKKLESDKNQIEENKKETEKTKAELDSKRAELKQAETSKQAEINKLSAEAKEKEEEIQKLNKVQAELNAQIARMSEILKRQQEAAAAAAKNNGSSSKPGSSTGSAGSNFDGTFMWPTKEKVVTSTMKWRWGRQHKGIDLKANYESVYAAAGGVAFNAYNAGGYGNYIMIFHGSGYVTLYGHLSSSKISDGQTVSKGQVIAISGNTGASTGPHLHFEIRKANSFWDYFSQAALDPLNYLPGGYRISE